MTGDERRTFQRAKLKWPVLVKRKDSVMEGVTKDIGGGGAYVRCAKPLKLNEVFDMVIEAPGSSLKIKAEVVWSKIYGPDDEINPRGMGVMFLEISDEDRQLISKAVNQHIAENVPPETTKSLLVGG
jgi:Tfp pilus assembly protein PilZ